MRDVNIHLLTMFITKARLGQSHSPEMKMLGNCLPGSHSFELICSFRFELKLIHIRQYLINWTSVNIIIESKF